MGPGVAICCLAPVARDKAGAVTAVGLYIEQILEPFEPSPDRPPEIGQLVMPMPGTLYTRSWLPGLRSVTVVNFESKQGQRPTSSGRQAGMARNELKMIFNGTLAGSEANKQ
jgi:hypothetical protein